MVNKVFRGAPAVLKLDYFGFLSGPQGANIKGRVAVVQPVFIY